MKAKPCACACVPPATVDVLCARVRELEALAFRAGDRVYDVDGDREGEVVRTERRGELVRVVVSYPGEGRVFEAPIALEHVEAGASLEAVLRVLEEIGAVAIGKSLVAALAAALAKITPRLARAVDKYNAGGSISDADLDAWDGAHAELVAAARVVVRRAKEAERASRKTRGQRVADVQRRVSRPMSRGRQNPSRVSRKKAPLALSASKFAEGAKTPGKRAKVAVERGGAPAPSSGTQKSRRFAGEPRAVTPPAKNKRSRAKSRRATVVHAPKGGA